MSKNSLWIATIWLIFCLIAVVIWAWYSGNQATRLYYYYYAGFLNVLTALATTFFCYHNTGLFQKNDFKRRAWQYLGIGLCFWSIGASLSLFHSLYRGVPVPYPWYSDIGYLLFVPFAFLSLVTLRMGLNVAVPFWAWITAFIMAMTISAIVLVINVENIKSIGAAAFMVTLAYVVVNPVLIATIITTSSVLAGQLICRPWWFALAGLFIFFIGDLFHVIFHNLSKPTNEIILDLTWPIAFGLIAVAATTTCSISRKMSNAARVAQKPPVTQLKS